MDALIVSVHSRFQNKGEILNVAMITMMWMTVIMTPKFKKQHPKVVTSIFVSNVVDVTLIVTNDCQVTPTGEL